MTVLTPMPASSFLAFLEAAIVSYARQNVEAGRWPAEVALELSKAEHEQLLPEGIASKDNYIFEIHDPTTNVVVGSLWLGIRNKTSIPIGHVFSIEIAEQHRRQGHATCALKALETVARDLGLPSIGLHVFAYNNGANALYASLGYEISGINMRRNL